MCVWGSAAQGDERAGGPFRHRPGPVRSWKGGEGEGPACPWRGWGVGRFRAPLPGGPAPAALLGFATTTGLRFPLLGHHFGCRWGTRRATALLRFATTRGACWGSTRGASAPRHSEQPAAGGALLGPPLRHHRRCHRCAPAPLAKLGPCAPPVQGSAVSRGSMMACRVAASLPAALLAVPSPAACTSPVCRGLQPVEAVSQPYWGGEGGLCGPGLCRA